MRGAFGKPNGTPARVEIGQILLSVRTKEATKAHAIEAFRRAKYKFPGRQQVQVSTKWGFTKYTKEEYLAYRAEGRIIPDGAHCKLAVPRGPLSNVIGA